jgi:hypothetical protein
LPAAVVVAVGPAVEVVPAVIELQLGLLSQQQQITQLQLVVVVQVLLRVPMLHIAMAVIPYSVL